MKFKLWFSSEKIYSEKAEIKLQWFLHEDLRIFFQIKLSKCFSDILNS